MKAYLVASLSQSGMTNIGLPMELKWATGMIGAMPVFKYKKDAKKYNKGSKSEIWELEIPESEEE